jgi:hypothetical protein
MELSPAGALWQAEAPAISLSQTLLVGIALVVLFHIGVYTIGLMARRLAVEDAGFPEAIWAIVLINVGSGIASAVFTGLGVPAGLTLLVVIAVFPVVVIKLVYSSTVGQAALMWLAVGIVEVVCGVILVFGAMSLGEWLDQRYDLKGVTT